MTSRMRRPTRRSFLQGALIAGSGVWIAERLPGRSKVPAGRLDKLSVAVIGCGGMGYHDGKAMASENVVALCDVDEERAAPLWAEFDQARRYHDFREMLDRERDLDAVVISTPDHTHAVAAAAALQLGLNVYCQKPLTHSVEEARVLRLLARRANVATQMGNQGTAADGFRRAVEVVRSGVLGAVREVHVWTDRPVWPQGIAAPEEIQPIPRTLRWDLWLGPARHRPYHSAYCPFRWRGFWDFGTGAIGDMACHTMNLPYLALELGAPERVVAEAVGHTEATGPKQAIVRYRFPARGERPPVDLVWYEGGKRPDAPWLPEGRELASGGSALVGEKGVLYAPGDYGTEWSLLPEADFADHVPPEPSLPRSPGIHAEWIAACKGGPKPMASFDYAGPFTEAALLGNVAIRAGVEIEWDAAALRIPNAPDAERFLRDEYRFGWRLV